jgi:hypothetical protein
MEPDLWERGGQHSESKLGEVVIEGECQADLKSLHYRETDGISEGEVFIGIPSEDALSALLVALPHTHDDSLALPHVMQELQSECRPQSRKDKCMRLDQQCVGGELTVASVRQRSDNLRCRVTVRIFSIQQGEVGGRICERATRSEWYELAQREW